MALSEGATRIIKLVLSAVNYDWGHWTRTVMYRECFKLIQQLNPQTLDVLEISAGDKFQRVPFKSFAEMNYPTYDICKDKLDESFDLIIADQVWEHLLWPYRAARNVYDMLRPGGYFLVTTPFLIRRHDIPHDCSRWTELGMKYFLAECGFPIERIQTWSWGNRDCVKANLNRWARRGWFGSLRNEPNFPVTVWVLACKTGAY
jgi:SAM-dependent methyltransferase